MEQFVLNCVKNLVGKVSNGQRWYMHLFGILEFGSSASCKVRINAHTMFVQTPTKFFIQFSTISSLSYAIYSQSSLVFEVGG